MRTEQVSSRLSWFKSAVALGVVLVGAAAWRGYRHDTLETTGEIRALQEQLSTLQTKARDVRRRSAPPVDTALPDSTPVVATAPASGRPTTPAQTTETPLPTQEAVSPELAEHRREAMNAALLSTFEKTHAVETPDPEWAPTARSSLEAGYAQEDFKGLNIKVDCRSTMCRIDFDYPDSPEGIEPARRVGRVRPWAGRGFTRVNTETREGHVYLARHGFDLPELDPTLIKD
jgi:hypothetical protein